MSKGPWVRFFPSDWLAGTRGMTAAETGIYITLVAMMYERGAPIQNDHARLARLCGTTPAAMKNTLSILIDEGKLVIIDGGLWNNRVGVETEIRSEKTTQAKKSAKARWQKDKQNQTQSDADALRAQCGGNANQKPDTRVVKEEPIGSSKKRGSRLPDDWQPDIEFAMSLGLSQAQALTEAEKFREWWPAQPGQKGVKLDWGLTWKTWCRKAAERLLSRRSASPPPGRRMNAVEAYLSMKSEQQHEPTSRTIDHRNDELLPPDEPRLQALVGQLGQAMRWPDGSSHH